MNQRVLLVDDEPMVCEVLDLVLAPQGYETLAVHTVAAAREAAARGPWAAALIDKNLPDGNGVELLAELRPAIPDTALLIMTGYSSFDTAVMAMRLGASDYLVKPFSTLDEVALRVRRAIDSLRRERERVLLESELDQARNELAAIFEAADEPMLVLDSDGKIRRANGAAKRAYAGVECGKELADLGDSEGAEAVTRAARGEVVRRERVTRRSPMGLVSMMATLAPIADHQGKISALVETAISIEETLRSQRALHQADKMSTLGALAATLAHELANPIGCALANMSVLGDVDDEGRILGTDPKDAAEIVREVRSSLSHCREIIRRTREFASPSSAPMQPVDLAKVAAEALRFAAPQVTQRVEMVTDVPADLQVLGDRVGLIQVIVNMLVNAGHALRGRIDPRIEVSGRLDGDEVVLSIRDNGCGIPERELPRIWERFFTTKPADQGTGLGLAVCRDIIRSHGGNIRVDSQVNRGTTFEIRTPSYHPARAARILIVDDDPLVLAATARALRGHFDVQTAGSADEAIELLALDEHGVDMVLSDFMMPGRNGADLLETVSQRWPGTKRLIMTGNLDPRARALIDQQAKPIDILLKPLECVLLRSRLLSILS